MADGAAFKSLAADPMPAGLRLGQKLFYSANSDDVPLTQNHWVSCATCHLEGRSSAVTWKVREGPRDTPSNAGGMLGTGFLFRTADRSQVQDYWQTIDPGAGRPLQPRRGIAEGPARRALELRQLRDPGAGAAAAHERPGTRGRRTDLQRPLEDGMHVLSLRPEQDRLRMDNPTLDLAGPILLHDVGTCVTNGAWPDVAHQDIAGHPREACAFDTPALRGLWTRRPTCTTEARRPSTT